MTSTQSFYEVLASFTEKNQPIFTKWHLEVITAPTIINSKDEASRIKNKICKIFFLFFIFFKSKRHIHSSWTSSQKNHPHCSSMRLKKAPFPVFCWSFDLENKYMSGQSNPTKLHHASIWLNSFWHNQCNKDVSY